MKTVGIVCAIIAVILAVIAASGGNVFSGLGEGWLSVAFLSGAVLCLLL